jgi:20S proteasome alpha/beta subunit
VTLLVGVLCSNGVVIAADRQATHGGMGQQTVGQSVTKVQVINGEALYATSGHKGLGQQLHAIVERKQPEFKNQGYAANIVKLQEAVRPIVDPAFQTARHAAGVLGNAAAGDCICGGLLAAGFKDGMKLIEITPQVAVEYMTADMPFISMGSGKASADPFLGFLRVEPSDKSCKARELEDAELAEHAEFMKAAEEALRGVRQALTQAPEASADVVAPPTL